MAWEVRSPGGHQYYYRKRRIGKRVISVYYGKSEAAALGVARAAALRREWRLFREAVDQVDRDLKELRRFVRDLTTAALIATDHYTHRRQWRKRGESMTTDIILTDEAPDMSTVLELARACNTEDPDPADVKAFRAALQHPDVWRVAGDLVKFTTKTIITAAAGKKQTVELSLARSVEALKEELGHDTAPPLQRILIEQVILTWLRHNWVAYQHQVMEDRADTTLTKATWWDKQLTASQHRFLRACQTLARVQKLAERTPALQVNFAHNQVNQVVS
jgi:hypothetical protein